MDGTSNQQDNRARSHHEYIISHSHANTPDPFSSLSNSLPQSSGQTSNGFNSNATNVGGIAGRSTGCPSNMSHSHPSNMVEELRKCIVCKTPVVNIEAHMQSHSKDELISALSGENASASPPVYSAPETYQNDSSSSHPDQSGNGPSPLFAPSNYHPQVNFVHGQAAPVNEMQNLTTNITANSPNILQPKVEVLGRNIQSPVVTKLYQPQTLMNNQRNFAGPLIIPSNKNVVMQQPSFVSPRVPIVVSQVKQNISYNLPHSSPSNTQPVSFLLVNSNKTPFVQSSFPINANNTSSHQPHVLSSGNLQSAPQVQFYQPHSSQHIQVPSSSAAMLPQNIQSPKIVLIGNGMISNNKNVVLTNSNNVQANTPVNQPIFVQGNRLSSPAVFANTNQQQYRNIQLLNTVNPGGQFIGVKNNDNGFKPINYPPPNSANNSASNDAFQTVQVGSNITISLPKDMANKKERLQQIINEELVRGIILNDNSSATKAIGQEQVNRNPEDNSTSLMAEKMAVDNNDTSYESNSEEENIGVGESSFFDKINETEYIVIKEEAESNVPGPSRSAKIEQSSQDLLNDTNILQKVEAPVDTQVTDVSNVQFVTTFTDVIKMNNPNNSKRQHENCFPSGSSSFKVVEMTEACEVTQEPELMPLEIKVR